jgi:hypothetical protein
MGDQQLILAETVECGSVLCNPERGIAASKIYQIRGGPERYAHSAMDSIMVHTSHI